ncbi:hypothetical protein LCGC14_2030790 [marine sediment metagenome]|uniref:Uncharacterized protein n=1 Tax=marine sediment metagenome TaxID=412755 RepID=A0A0F9FHD0_9ZZZZ
MIHKCEVFNSCKENCEENCGKKARFKIVDCGCEYGGDYKKPFWVCDDCIKHFIVENEYKPHYILLEVCST